LRAKDDARLLLPQGHFRTPGPAKLLRAGPRTSWCARQKGLF